YYINAPINLYGTTTIEGGTVIKYGTNPATQLLINGTLASTTSRYRPAILTCKDDDTVGWSIIGSSSVPSGNYATAALNFTAAGSVTLQNFRVSHAKTAMLLNPGVSGSFTDVQLGKCQNGILATNTSFHLYNELSYVVTPILTPTLRANLRTQATFPPVLVANAIISANSTYVPQVARDTNTLDLGYHYDPMDYAVGGLTVTNATLTVSPGTVVAVFG